MEHTEDVDFRGLNCILQMEKVKARLSQVELMVESLDERVQDHDKSIVAMKPAVQQASHRNVIVWIAAIITILNTIILLMNG